MKFLILLINIFSIHLCSAEFKLPETSPKLTIKKVSVDEKEPEWLVVTFDLQTTGKGRFSIGLDQFWVLFSTDDEPFRFSGEAVFDKGTPKVINVSNKKGVTLTLRCKEDKHGRKQGWKNLPDGVYDLQVRLNSGKLLKFDYHWRGQTYSKEKVIRLPLKNNSSHPTHTTRSAEK